MALEELPAQACPGELAREKSTGSRNARRRPAKVGRSTTRRRGRRFPGLGESAAGSPRSLRSSRRMNCLRRHVPRAHRGIRTPWYNRRHRLRRAAKLVANCACRSPNSRDSTGGARGDRDAVPWTSRSEGLQAKEDSQPAPRRGELLPLLGRDFRFPARKERQFLGGPQQNLGAVGGAPKSW